MGLTESDPRFGALREGPGATAMELFDEFQEEYRRVGPSFLGAPLAPPVLVVAPDISDSVPPQIETSDASEPPQKRLRTDNNAPLVAAKEEQVATAQDAMDTTENTNALDVLINAAA